MTIYIFTENITHGENGQFFTPETITDLMAGIVGDSREPVSGKTLCDPACGSGRTLLSFAKNNSRNNYFFGADIDLRCAKMCAVNLCLNGMRGQVAHMNSLAFEIYEAYEIFFDSTRRFVPTIRKIAPEASVFHVHRENLRARAEQITFPDRSGQHNRPVTQLALDLFA